MAQAVPQHQHCNMCGKSIPFGETLCSEECKQKFQTLVKRRKLVMYLLYGMIAAFIVVYIVFGNN